MLIDRFSPLNPPQHRVDAARAGGLVFVAGMTALNFDENGRWDPEQPLGDVVEQAQAVTQKIDTVLTAAGTDKSRLLWANVWLADTQDYEPFNKVWNSWVTPGCQPTRACVGAVLAVPGLRVEVAVVAAASDTWTVWTCESGCTHKITSCPAITVLDTGHNPTLYTTSN